MIPNADDDAGDVMGSSRATGSWSSTVKPSPLSRSYAPLRAAGDGRGRADVSAVERLCEAHPDGRLLVTFLSRENRHELCVSARKFPNLLPFGCRWFLNNPSIIREITTERIELLGTRRLGGEETRGPLPAPRHGVLM